MRNPLWPWIATDVGEIFTMRWTREAWRGFSLVELLVSLAVLAVLLVFISQIFGSATAVTGSRNQRMDADAQARAVFGRMAVDFAQMIRRPDVDYFLKSAASDASGSNPQAGNDRMAFYSQVPGYSSASAAMQSPVSVVAWRINESNAGGPLNHLERLGCGLEWSGASSLAYSGPSGPLVSASGDNRISSNWPAAVSATQADSRYENAGPEVFRLEYYYFLRGQSVNGIAYPSMASATPWDTRIPGRSSVDGLRDVAAIVVTIAVVDPKSRQLITDEQLAALADRMKDFDASTMTSPGDLKAQWQSVIEDAGNGIPRSAATALHTYERTFSLSPAF